MAARRKEFCKRGHPLALDRLEDAMRIVKAKK
jgi:hypothetical protein